MGKKHDIVELDCYVRHETGSAYLVEVGPGKKEWVPKKMCQIDEKGGSLGECDLLQLPEWLAVEKGFV